jgi:hypothetical protein
LELTVQLKVTVDLFPKKKALPPGHFDEGGPLNVLNALKKRNFLAPAGN